MIESFRRSLKQTNYRNGDPILHAQSNRDWIGAGDRREGAYCVSPTFGFLYNWHAVNDPRGLAPEGWVIPNDEQLEAIRRSWLMGDMHGMRDDDGVLYGHGEEIAFWSSGEFSPNTAWSRGFDYRRGESNGYGTNFAKGYGLAVCCIKNATKSAISV